MRPTVNGGSPALPLSCENGAPIGGSFDVHSELAQAQSQYEFANPSSCDLYHEALHLFPGGNTRSSLFCTPFPLTIHRAVGARVWDTDNHEYIDFLGDYTAGLFGHSEPAIQAAVIDAVRTGLTRGGQTTSELELGNVLKRRFPSVQRLRFCNSGTEANLLALSCACHVTSRPLIIAFDGAFHGSLLSFSRGPSAINAPFQFHIAQYNSVEDVDRLLGQHGSNIAAIIVEPMIGSGGCIPGSREFLTFLRERTQTNGSLLIFDEVMTSRLSYGGLQEVFGITPDITTLGKYLGGGNTFGAFGGNEDIMRTFDLRNEGAVQHGGTFNNNAISMAAGAAAARLLTRELCEELNARGKALRDRLNHICKLAGVSMCFTGIGSMMHVHFSIDPPIRPRQLSSAEGAWRSLFFHVLLNAGIYIGNRGFISYSLPITPTDEDAIIDAVHSFAHRYAYLLGHTTV